jgi:non-canonical poly(A) RNA polymerase PAPD5/7
VSESLIPFFALLAHVILMTWVTYRLHKEVTAFIEFLSPTPEEHEVRGLIITLISQTISAAFPDATVLPFGSYETKLYLPLG